MKGSNADSSDPGKVSKPTDPVEFKVPEKEFSMEEVSKHNKKDDLWIAVKGWYSMLRIGWMSIPVDRRRYSRIWEGMLVRVSDPFILSGSERDMRKADCW